MNQLAPETAATAPEGTVKIRIEGLRKSFGDLVVLDGIDTTIREGRSSASSALRARASRRSYVA